MNVEQTVMQNEKQLQQNKYPGRGIIIGMTPDERSYMQLYWIMGRSSNSRNRIFKAEGSSVRTEAFDESKMEDPSLIIYYPVRALENYHIVSNGDQTDTILDYLRRGQTFEDALETREFEPDKPNFTPRISGIIDYRTQKADYGLSILKSVHNNEEICQRSYFYYNSFMRGFGHCIHTYKEDGDPIPSFEGEPYIVRLYNKIEDNLEYYWNLLNEDNKISILAKSIDIKNKTTEIRILNKNN